MKIDFETRDIFKDPLSEDEIKQILLLSKMTPSDLLRKKDKMYKQLKLENKKHTDTKLIKYMTEYPGLIKRPIIFTKNGVHIGKINKTTYD
jgi:arsenate reductase-like glutaredoxin family protein